ncbi:MAG: EAL domain-containing protein [Aquisalimonadaceae bacterium]
MRQLVRILHLEDDCHDAEIIGAKLKAGLVCDVVRVDSGEKYKAALRAGAFDLVLCDYNLPDYDGVSALKLSLALQPHVPVIMVSGTVGEDEAIRCLHEGATDYLLKQRMAKLIPAVTRALREAEEHARRRRSEAALRHSEQRFRELMALQPVAVYVCDRRGNIREYNQAAVELWGRAPGKAERFCGSFRIHRLGGDYLPHDQCPMANALCTGEEVHNAEVVFERPDGRRVPVIVNIARLRNSAGETVGAINCMLDITERKRAEERIQFLGLYDSLTHLPNRRLLVDRLHHAIATHLRSGRFGATVFIDLDDFKTLNDTLGHEQGDLLLQQVAARLRGSLREGDTVARLGGDEFVVILEGLSESADAAVNQATVLVNKVLIGLRRPFELDGLNRHMTASIGVTLFGDRQSTAEELMKRADLAMYQAKAEGRNTVRFFDPTMQIAINARAQLEADLRHGLERGEFLLYYQPQVDERGCVTGSEALVRWRHPRRGLVAPAEFITVAETTGLIVPLGRFLLHQACQQLAAWAGCPQTALLNLSVNVSPRQFHHPDFVADVLDLIRGTGANPERLRLELTESLLLEDVEEAAAKMKALQARGIGFSLDDFGTGCSSLYYLKHLPLYELKIDQGFVKDVLTDSNDEAIVRTIIVLGKTLGLNVIAEGVETREVQEFLASQGCLAYQGFQFSRPLGIEDFEIFVARSGRWALGGRDLA